MAGNMATLKSVRRKVRENLHKMFENLQINMNSADADRLRAHFSIMPSVTLRELVDKRSKKLFIPRKLYKCDAFTFLRFLEQKGLIDESNIKLVKDSIRDSKPELYELATTGLVEQVETDPVVEYLEMTAPKQLDEMTTTASNYCRRSLRHLKHKCEESTSEKIESRLRKRRKVEVETSNATSTNTSCNIPDPMHSGQTLSCDIRLRVKVEYVDHQEVLRNSIHSNKQHEMERQFDMFHQASTIIKSRDLGTVVCDIKFSELTSLDAFWRDYTKGALLEALKVVFITESLSDAVGQEALRLIVSVDEDEYRKGRLRLLKNLTG